MTNAAPAPGLIAPRVLVRNPLRFPTSTQFSRGLIAQIERLQQRARDAAAAATPARLQALCDGTESARWMAFAADLQHPLSRQLVDSRNGVALRDARSAAAELAIFRHCRATLIAALRNDEPSALQRATRDVCAAATGAGDIDCRRTPMALEAGPDGNRVEFGDWQDVPARLAELQHDFRHSTLPSAMKAVAALAVMLNIHAFPDGNGRCARALFNAALNLDDSELTAYVPLRLVFDVSLGGFELRLRDAEIHANWAPLVSYFTTVLQAQRQLADDARSAAGRRPVSPAATVFAPFEESR